MDHIIFYFDQVFDRIAPDLTSEYDAPYSIPAIAPRPLLIINGNTFFIFISTGLPYSYTTSYIHDSE